MSKSVNDLKELRTRAKEVADGAMQTLRDQARRQDRIGEVTHRTWELVHGGVGVAARSLTRLEHAIQPPARVMKRTPAARRSTKKTNGDS